MVNGLKSMVCGLLLPCALLSVCLPAMAGEDEAAGSDQYQWQMEGDAGAAAQPATEGVSVEAYDKVVKENQSLRKTSGELAARMQALESARKSAAVKDGGADLATTLEENLTLQEKNRSLQAEAAKLRIEVDRLRARDAGAKSGAGVSEKSDLFKRLQEENATLQREVQKYRETVQQTTEQGSRSATEGTQAKQRLAKLEEENSWLRKAVLKLDKQVQEAAGLQNKIDSIRAQLTEKDQLIAGLERERDRRSAVRNNVEKAVREIESFRSEQSNLLFNLGVMYTKAGLYREAVDAFRQVLKAQPDATDAHFNLGVIYQRHLSDGKRAQQHYRKFLELDPLNVDAGRVKLWLLELEISG
ncbi:MAG: tetratricopeptide repeat protein [bacterium]